MREKLLDRDEVAKRCEVLRTQGKRVGFTSGVFDLLHPGHVDYLEKARAQCDLLVVGINSDSSVRENKGTLRPIVTGHDRAVVVTALSSVDMVFLFDERNNNRNIELLRPALYLKAGDYDRSKLSSASIVESYGGKVEVVPFLSGYSSSKIIERIVATQAGSGAAFDALPPPKPAPAVFLDRDGVINQHVEYLHDPDKFQLVPGALEAMKLLKERGFRVVVITNQPGIGLGYYTFEDFFVVNRKLLRATEQAGFTLDRVYFCPHSTNDQCACRKPATGMVDRAVRELAVDLSRSYLVGDMTSDIQLGHRVGVRSILVKTGIGGADKRYQVRPDFVAEDLSAAVRYILTDASAH